MSSQYIKCDHHGTAKGYNVCEHVCRNEQIKIIIPPRDNRLGLIACGRPPIAEDIKRMKVICEFCAIDKGMITKNIIQGGLKIHESVIENKRR